MRVFFTRGIAMKTKRNYRVGSSIAALVLISTGWSAPLAAETANCTAITALPAIIGEQGVYCLTATLSTDMTSGNAITILSNNVVLDLKGFALANSAGLGTNAIGIGAVDGRNITIRNGTVRGFLTAIYLVDTGKSQGNVVEDMRVDRNRLFGILAAGRGNVIRNNYVIGTGGSTCCGPGMWAIGISVLGNSPRVLNNDVIDTTSPGDVASRGIRFSSGVGGIAVNNRISGADIAIDFDLSATGKYRDNLTFDGIYGGTDAGNNH